VRVVRVARQADAAQRGRVAASEDGDSIEALLAVPHGAVTGRLDIRDRKRLIGAFELLQAHDVGLFALEPFDQTRQARANPVEVVAGELHARRLAAAA
jgi:hypothetical protein